MSFASPVWLWLLGALPLLALLEWRAVRRAERDLGVLVGTRKNSVLLEQRFPGQRRVGMALRLGGVALLALGAAGPEWGRELVRRSAQGSEVVLVLDVSASMDVRDVPPSRLEEARREALAVVEHLPGSKIGVVAFAGDAVRLCPLTLDRSAVRLVLESLSSGTVSQPGSDLGRGLRNAARLLRPQRRTEQAIVVWTDGEDLEEGARGAVEELARAGLRVMAVGVGTAAGDIVPVLDPQGRVVDVKREPGGGPVRSRLDERLLQGVARQTQGGYFSASRPGGELPRLLASLGAVRRGGQGAAGSTRERLTERPITRFPWFAAGAAVLLAAELTRRRRRTPGGRPVPGPPVRAMAGCALALAAAMVPAAWAQSDWAKGDARFREGRWADADSLYARRAARGGPAEVRVNLATARVRSGKIAAGEEELRRARSAPRRAGQTASFNLGTLLAQQRRDDEALAELRRALERDPADADARHNYEWVLRRRRERPSSQPEPQTPRPEPSEPQAGAPDPRPAAPAPAPVAQAPPVPSPQAGEGLTRAQAEQLLASLQELERLEQQRLRQVRVMRERRGRDW